MITPFNSRRYSLVAALAILLLVFAAMVAACEDCKDETSNPQCPFCHVANLTMTRPAPAPQPAPRTTIARYISITSPFQELESAFSFASPRAPPA